MIYFLVHCKQIYDKFVRDEITVYAAQASFFIVLSSVPFIILLLTVLQFVPAVQQSDLLYLLSRLLPIEVQPLVYTIIGEIYSKSSAALLSVSSIVTLWSAARGMQGIERGLNRIIGCSLPQKPKPSEIILYCAYFVVYGVPYQEALSHPDLPKPF